MISGSPQVSVSHLLALSGFPLKIIDISVAHINRLGVITQSPWCLLALIYNIFFSRMPITATGAYLLFQKNTRPLDFLFLNVMTFNYNKMSFYCFSAGDISASPWTSNAPDAVHQILVHNGTGSPGDEDAS